jgi:hypothetical protein
MEPRYILPAFTLVLLTLAVGILMFYRRAKAVFSNQLRLQRFKTLSIADAPEDVLKAERHFINLFEVPVLFYSACVIAAFMPLRAPGGIFVAWTFVALRFIQACIHVWPNKLIFRMTAFLTGFATVVVFWTMIACEAMDLIK